MATSDHAFRSLLRRLWTLVLYLWASPYTLLGWLLGGMNLLGGGRVQWVAGVWEFHGPLLARGLNLLPLARVMALTLGHTVLARHSGALEVTREHERVHVRQFERWGPLLGPAYLGCSLLLWLRGRDWYRENPFERQAYDACPAVECPSGDLPCGPFRSRD